jgi:hypothetical protein
MPDDSRPPPSDADADLVELQERIHDLRLLAQHAQGTAYRQ